MSDNKKVSRILIMFLFTCSALPRVSFCESLQRPETFLLFWTLLVNRECCMCVIEKLLLSGFSGNRSESVMEMNYCGDYLDPMI